MESAPERMEEEKLLAKYPNISKKGVAQSVLQKRLNKPLKYFDSGDYNMAKAKSGSVQEPEVAAKDATEYANATIPTTDTVTVVRKRSMAQNEKPTPSALAAAAASESSDAPAP